MRKLIYLLSVLLLFSCTKNEEPEVITTNDINFSVTFDEDFENTIYPSLILALSDYDAKQDENFDFFRIKGTVPVEFADLKIEIEETNLNYKTTIHETINGKGSDFEIRPEINWKFEALKTIDQPGNITIPFTCYIDGNEIDTKNLKLSYRSVNECIFAMMKDGEFIDMGWMFGAYVNENHPLIDPFLEDCLNNELVTSFSGYQDTSLTSVLSQVFSIWFELQKQGVKYSSITNTGNNSSNIYSQHVRFFDQVYQNTQANCVDGSVFFCSVLQKIGIETFLVKVPGHMYMGFYNNKDQTQILLLETTMIGNVNLNDYSSAEDKIKASFDSYMQALAYQNDSFFSNADKFSDAENFEYNVYEISSLRQAILPISR